MATMKHNILWGSGVAFALVCTLLVSAGLSVLLVSLVWWLKYTIGFIGGSVVGICITFVAWKTLDACERRAEST